MTGVQTCALPICLTLGGSHKLLEGLLAYSGSAVDTFGEHGEVGDGLIRLEHQCVDVLADLEGLGLLAGGVEIGLIMGRGLEQLFASAEIQRLHGIVDYSVGDRDGHGGEN